MEGLRGAEGGMTLEVTCPGSGWEERWARAQPLPGSRPPWSWPWKAPVPGAAPVPAGPEAVRCQPLRGGVLPPPGVLRQDAVCQNLLQRLPPGLPPVGAPHREPSADRRGPPGRSPRLGKPISGGSHERRGRPPKPSPHTHPARVFRRSAQAWAPGLAAATLEGLGLPH